MKWIYGIGMIRGIGGQQGEGEKKPPPFSSQKAVDYRAPALFNPSQCC
jgi:hypothetical protein